MDLEAKSLIRAEIEAQIHKILDYIEILNDLLKTLFAEV